MSLLFLKKKTVDGSAKSAIESLYGLPSVKKSTNLKKLLENKASLDETNLCSEYDVKGMGKVRVIFLQDLVFKLLSKDIQPNFPKASMFVRMGYLFMPESMRGKGSELTAALEQGAVHARSTVAPVTKIEALNGTGTEQAILDALSRNIATELIAHINSGYLPSEAAKILAGKEYTVHLTAIHPIYFKGNPKRYTEVLERTIKVMCELRKKKWSLEKIQQEIEKGKYPHSDLA